MDWKPLTPEEVLKLLRTTRAHLSGHFVLSSGLHSDTYIEKFRLLERPEYTERLCREITRRFRELAPQVVIGPTTGGIIVSYEVARQLGARAIFAERESGRMQLRRGFYIDEGERTLIVEDVVTTGGSVAEVIELVKRCGGEILGVGTLVDRSGGRVDLGVRYEPLLVLDITAWSSETCPLCARGIPLSERGSRGRLAR